MQGAAIRAACALGSTAIIAACASSGDTPVPTADPIVLETSTTLGTIAVAALEPGDCLTGLVVGGDERITLASVHLASCDGPHELETFAVFDLPAAEDYPGRERVVRAADDECEERLEATVENPDEFGIVSFWPTNESWLLGDRGVACAAFNKDGSVFESFELVP